MNRILVPFRYLAGKSISGRTLLQTIIETLWVYFRIILYKTFNNVNLVWVTPILLDKNYNLFDISFSLPVYKIGMQDFVFEYHLISVNKTLPESAKLELSCV